MASLVSLRAKVQQKPELASLAACVVDDTLVSCLAKHRLSPSSIGKLSAREAQLIIKEARQRLRLLTGRFQRGRERHRPRLLATRRYQELLSTHASTAHRIKDYPRIKRELATRQVTSILDLGAGLNPIALATPGMVYYAVDIRKDERSLVAAFFHQEKIAGTTLVCDLRKTLPPLPPVDACLLMNVLDIIEKGKGHKRAEQIITNTKAKYFFITFSTKTLSAKPMRHPQRGWIELLLTRRGYAWKRIPLSAEVLYIARAPNIA